VNFICEELSCGEKHRVLILAGSGSIVKITNNSQSEFAARKGGDCGRQKVILTFYTFWM